MSLTKEQKNQLKEMNLQLICALAEYKKKPNDFEYCIGFLKELRLLTQKFLQLESPIFEKISRKTTQMEEHGINLILLWKSQGYLE